MDILGSVTDALTDSDHAECRGVTITTPFSSFSGIPIYIALHGGEWEFRKSLGSATFFHRIDTEFGMLVDSGNTELFERQIFDICPQKNLAPL